MTGNMELNTKNEWKAKRQSIMIQWNYRTKPCDLAVNIPREARPQMTALRLKDPIRSDIQVPTISVVRLASCRLELRTDALIGSSRIVRCIHLALLLTVAEVSRCIWEASVAIIIFDA